MGKEIRARIEEYIEYIEHKLAKRDSVKEEPQQSSLGECAEEKIQIKKTKNAKLKAGFHKKEMPQKVIKAKEQKAKQRLGTTHLFMIREVSIPIFDQVVEVLVEKKDEALIASVIKYIRELQKAGEHINDAAWNAGRWDDRDAIVKAAMQEIYAISDLKQHDAKMLQIMFFETSLHRLFSLATGVYKTYDIDLFAGIVTSEHPLSDAQQAETHEVITGVFGKFIEHLEETFGLGKSLTAATDSKMEVKADALAAPLAIVSEVLHAQVHSSEVSFPQIELKSDGSKEKTEDKDTVASESRQAATPMQQVQKAHVEASSLPMIGHSTTRSTTQQNKALPRACTSAHHLLADKQCFFRPKGGALSTSHISKQNVVIPKAKAKTKIRCAAPVIEVSPFERAMQSLYR